MKIACLVIGGFALMLSTAGWCQPQAPSTPGKTLKRDQETREYYHLQDKLGEAQKGFDRKNDRDRPDTARHDEIEVEAEDEPVIQYLDDEQMENGN